MAKSYLAPNEVAEMLRVSPVTLRQWSQKGLIEYSTTAGNHRRYTIEAVRRFAEDNGIELAGESSLDLLIVDDEVPYNKMLVEAMRSFGPTLRIESALNGFEAGRLVQLHRPRVILLDILMPGMDGIEVCEVIKSDPDTSGCCVIGMTGHYSTELDSRMATAGALTLLRKPIGMGDLVTLLRDVGLELED